MPSVKQEHHPEPTFPPFPLIGPPATLQEAQPPDTPSSLPSSSADATTRDTINPSRGTLSMTPYISHNHTIAHNSHEPADQASITGRLTLAADDSHGLTRSSSQVPQSFYYPAMTVPNDSHGNHDMATKRRRPRPTMNLLTCRLCGRTFRYQRPHFQKYHPELSTASGQLAPQNAQMHIHMLGSQETTDDGEDCEEAADVSRPSNNLARSSVSGNRPGTFCARCGLVVEDWASHQKRVHGVELADSADEPLQTHAASNVARGSSNKSLPRPDRSSPYSGQILLPDQRAARIQSTQRPKSPIGTHAFAPNPRSSQSATRRSRQETIALVDVEEPYEKLLRIIRSTAELNEKQKMSLIFDTLKQQITLLSYAQSMTTNPLSNNTPVTPQGTTTAAYFERDVGNVTPLLAMNGSPQDRPMSGGESAKRDFTERDADADDLFS